MSFVPHTPEETAHMLRAVGAASIAELLSQVPADLQSTAALKLAEPLGERSLHAMLTALAERNISADRAPSFLGAGAYHHFIPSAVDALTSRGEVLTAYTPYQAEVSQGTLQAIFEFQTMICQLAGLDVSNASLYDGASATAEAVLLALRVTRRRRVLVSAGLHPHYRQVLDTYLGGLDVEVDVAPLDETGRTSLGGVTREHAAMVLQQPSFFGCVEQPARHAALAKEAGALTVVSTAEALALALLRSPGEDGADIACGEAQSFGIPLGFGGPYCGYLATRSQHVRQLPGRLVGETVDAAGERAFVMTLTTREQHIRRERATSNICTNQGLCALRVAIYLALLGRNGLRDLAQANLSLLEYARTSLAARGIERVYAAPSFNEMVVRVPKLDERLAVARDAGLLPGIRLADLDPTRRDQLLICVTEMNTREEIDRLAAALAA